MAIDVCVPSKNFEYSTVQKARWDKEIPGLKVNLLFASAKVLLSGEVRRYAPPPGNEDGRNVNSSSSGSSTESIPIPTTGSSNGIAALSNGDDTGVTIAKRDTIQGLFPSSVTNNLRNISLPQTMSLPSTNNKNKKLYLLTLHLSLGLSAIGQSHRFTLGTVGPLTIA